MSFAKSKSSLGVLVIGSDSPFPDWLGELFGDRIRIVSNWMEAVAEVSTNKYQLVLGEITGKADQNNLAIRGLRAADKHVRIVLYCHPVCEPLARSALEAGADDYLVEPMTKRDFLRTLNGQLSGLDLSSDRTDPKGLAEGSLSKSLLTMPEPPAAQADKFHTLDPAALARSGDAYDLCGRLLRVARSGAEYFFSNVQKILAEELGVQWVQLLLLDEQTSDQTPGDVSLEHMVELARGGKLLIRLGPSKTAQSTVGVCQHVLSQISPILGSLADISLETAALQKLAVTDELTGLYNRRYVYEFTEQVLARAHAERFEVTTLLFDVDDFKQYNDNYGHATGDEVLRETADLMRRCSREHDLVGRFGGDEFVMIFWDAEQRRQPNSRHPQTAFALSERFRRTVNAHDYRCLGPDAKGTLTIRGGLASFPWDASTVDDLFARADDALLQAKASGKNRIYIVGRAGH